MAKLALILMLCTVAGCAAPIVYEPPMQELRAAPTVEFVIPSSPAEAPFARGISFLDGHPQTEQQHFQVVAPGYRQIGANCLRDKDVPAINSFAFLEHMDYQVTCENEKVVIHGTPRAR
jgi:hypothetical protein